MNRKERNDTRVMRWMCIVRSDTRIYEEEIKTRLKFHKMRGCLQIHANDGLVI